MGRLVVLLIGIAVSGCAQQTGTQGFETGAPTAAPRPPPAAVAEQFDGAYEGSLTLQLVDRRVSLSYGNLNRPGCVSERAATAVVRRGIINIEYADGKRHRLHYKGKIDATGAVTAYHRNSGGSASILNGQISGGVLTGKMQHGPCSYTVVLAGVHVGGAAATIALPPRAQSPTGNMRSLIVAPRVPPPTVAPNPNASSPKPSTPPPLAPITQK